MKKNSVLLGLLAVFSLSAFGCGEKLFEEAIEAVTYPKNIYHSGNDFLSGSYAIVAKAGDDEQKRSTVLTLKQTEKGWDVHQNTAKGVFPLFEMPPEKTQEFFKNFNAQTMQCGEYVFAKLCMAPKGTKTRDGKYTFETGYLLIEGENEWNHLRKQ